MNTEAAAEAAIPLQRKTILPDKRVRIAVVGLNFGRHIIQSELLTGSASEFFEIGAVCDQDAQRANEIGSSLGVKAYDSLDRLLADDTIPAVALYTGPGNRAELLGKIIRAGKDVMTTKPFEVDPDAADAVLREAHALGRVVHLNSPAPVLPPELAQIEQWRREFDLGRPVACRADTWIRYREVPDNTWYDDPERCPVAPVLRLGIYLINDLVTLFGKAERVQVLSSRLFTGRPTVDNAQLGIRFESGALANVFASFCINDGDHYRNSLVLNFENGTIYRNASPQRTKFGDAESVISLATCHNGRRTVTADVLLPPSGHYRWDIFHRAIMREVIPDLLPRYAVVEGLRLVRAMAVAERSGESVLVH